MSSPPAWSRQLRPVLGQRARELETAWLTATPQERHEIEVIAQMMLRRLGASDQPMLSPPSASQADGLIRLGRIKHGTVSLGHVGLSLGELLQHMLVVGRSGSGKSNLVHSVLLQLRAQGIPWIVTDHKRSTRHLLTHPDSSGIRVCSLGRDYGATFRFNPLVAPPGLTPDVHCRQVVEEICGTFTGGDAAFAVIVQAIQDLSVSGMTPTLVDVRDSVRRADSGGRAGPWKQTSLRILEEIINGPLGRVFCSDRDAGDIKTLLDGHTVLELDGLARQHGALVTNLLLRQLHNHLLATVDREQLKLLVCLEEAHELAPKRDGARESVIETVIRQGRESGLGLLLATQSPVTLSQVALSNCYAVVALNLRSRNDIAAAAQNLLLDSSGAELLATLPVGQAVCRLSDRWPRPVHLEIPEVALDKGLVTDAEVLASGLSDPLAAGNSAHSADCTSIHPTVVSRTPIPRVPQSDRGMSTSGTAQIPPSAVELALEEPSVQALLRDVAEYPYSTVSKRYDRMGVSRRKGNAARVTAERVGILSAIPLATERGSLVLLGLRDPARAWLRRHRVSITPVNGGFCPELAGRDPVVLGHPHYAHPERLKRSTFDSTIDQFPLLVITTSLRMLSRDPSLWTQIGGGTGEYDPDCLLFRQHDYESGLNSPAFKAVTQHSDSVIRALGATLLAACGHSAQRAARACIATQSKTRSPLPTWLATRVQA